MTSPTPIETVILELTAACGPARSICPTDVARVLDPAPGEGWRRHLTAIRRSAARLAEDGQIEILRKGKKVEPQALRGVIRLRTTTVPGP